MLKQTLRFNELGHAFVGGAFNYNVVIESFGTFYKQHMQFKIVVNQVNGKITKISKL